VSDLNQLPMTRVAFTRLDKVLYPEPGITKARVIEYYIRIAPYILPFLAERPLTLHRFPDGTGGPGFYEKDAPEGIPGWVETYTRHSLSAGRDVRYVVCSTLDTLMWLANLAALELHISLSRRMSFETPDYALFDLDPHPPAGFAEATAVALALRTLLSDLGLACYVKTTGQNGLHVVVPVMPAYSFSQVRSFVRLVGGHLAREIPFVSLGRAPALQAGNVVIDYAQNAPGRTMVAPYSLRTRPFATVSAPVDWNELAKGIDPGMFTLETVPHRRTHPWKNLFKSMQKLEFA
jgi:bifunctional non-homologous end joining protein LigD